MNRRTAKEFDQELLDLYDYYVHGQIDRRGFLDRAAKFAVGGLTAAALLELLSPKYAFAAQVPADDGRVATEYLKYPSPDGSGEMRGLFAKPAGATGKLPGIVVVHENRGLNPHIKDVTRRMALEGFVALGIDLLSRAGGTPATDDEAAAMFDKIDRAGLVPDAVAAIAYLQSYPASNGNVGAIGFCFGGGIVNQMAVNSPDLKAGVAYYGNQPKEGVDKIKAKLMLHYAGLDERIGAGIADYEAALKAAGVDYQLFMYDNVNHAFNNDTSEARYNKEAADLAWSRTVAFLKEALG